MSVAPLWFRLLTELATSPTSLMEAYRPASNREEAVVRLDAPLKPHEHRLLDHYAGEFYHLYNHLLKYGTFPPKDHWSNYVGAAPMGVGKDQIVAMAKGAVQVLQAIFARSQVTRPLVVYRGAKSYEEFGGWPEWLAPGAPPDPEAQTPEYTSRFFTGKTRTFRKFVSTSRFFGGAQEFNETRNPHLFWRFLVDEGTPAIDIFRLAMETDTLDAARRVRLTREQEILFPVGTTARMLGAHEVSPTLDPYQSDYWREILRDETLGYTSAEINGLYDDLVGQHTAFTYSHWPYRIFLVTAKLKTPPIGKVAFPEVPATETS